MKQENLSTLRKVITKSAHSMFLEIHLTKLTELAKLTYVHSSVSVCILHPDVLCKKYTGMNFTNNIQSKAF